MKLNWSNNEKTEKRRCWKLLSTNIFIFYFFLSCDISIFMCINFHLKAHTYTYKKGNNVIFKLKETKDKFTSFPNCMLLGIEKK